ncbi:NADH-quinone oxidoreductase subunit C [Polymorphobacter sp. PAMC 29334]|uniref:NADH-quinone oxidoreductase subunit C n=1 Tax=Polymorphobacter sp. PAMC 29334 TaxID=2862331 RepID=UPI001C78F5AC|nr:NADH-quinone oxidoreductase subunit C [Polymorphobacter sp. PAMC 29334]QYE34012.1 NADH-quinone oxidoreductase subunit C [Polymorphobacter sp. PAMC 29334]
MSTTAHWPQTKPDDSVQARIEALFGSAVLGVTEHAGELTVLIVRDAIVDVITGLRDDPDLAFNQLMDLSGADYPERVCRFDVNYHLLSLTKNRRLRVKLHTDDTMPVPSITGVFPVAGWFERETWDCYGVLFEGNPDLRRILTDYGFQGHPFRKDFPLTGYVELRYSEEHKRVVYEPVQLAQDFRNFDFLSPWEGTDYILPGDEKAQAPQAGAVPTAPAQVPPVPTADSVAAKAKPNG